ncbi:nuclease-related domain-containing protein [Arthrobacter sp. TMN-37]
MTAGDGAAEQARLAAERVQRLRRQLEKAEDDERAWAAGAAGEVLVAGRMAELERSGWLVLHDVHWPGRPKANIDHLAIGPGGILVIDAKNWSGDVSLRHGELIQNGHSRSRSTAAALEQAAAVAALLEPQHRTLVQAWLCMVGQPAMRGATAAGVRIEGIDTLTAAAAALPEVLEGPFVAAIHTYLAAQLTGPGAHSLLTTATLDPSSAASQGLDARRRAARQRAGRVGGARGSRPDAGPWSPRPSRTAPRGSSRRRKKRQGLVRNLLQLVLLLVVLSLVREVTAQLSEPSVVPVPAGTGLIQPAQPPASP